MGYGSYQEGSGMCSLENCKAEGIGSRVMVELEPHSKEIYPHILTIQLSLSAFPSLHERNIAAQLNTF